MFDEATFRDTSPIIGPDTSPIISKVWERFVDDVFLIFKRTHLEKFFHPINDLHQNIEESNGKLAFLETLLKQNNRKFSVLVYRKPMHTDKHLHYTSDHLRSVTPSLPIGHIPL